MDGFRWLFKLDSETTGLKAARGELSGFKSDLKGLQSEGGGAMKGVSSGFMEMAGKASVLAVGFQSVLAIGGQVFDALKGIGEAAFDIGMGFSKAVVGSASFAENTKIAFSTILGDGRAADDLLRSIVKTASTLPITTQEAVGFGTSFITGGFKPDDMKTLLTATADIGALNPARSSEAREFFVNEIRRIKSEGYLDERTMRFLPQVIGISGEKLNAQLAKITGAKDTEGVRKLISQRAITSEQGIYALISTIKEMEGGKIGNLSNKLAYTVGGLFSTIKSRFFESTMDLAESPAYKGFESFLHNIADLTDTTTDEGKRIKTAIGDTFGSLFGSIFGGFSGEGGKARIQGVIRKVLEFAEAIPPAISAIADDVGQMISGLVGDTGTLKATWKDALDPDAIRRLGPTFRDLGEGIRSAASAALELASGLTKVMAFGHGAKVVGNWLLQTATLGMAGGVGSTLTGGDFVSGWASGLKDIVGGGGSEDLDVPKHADGGITTRDHLAMVHKDEGIIPLDRFPGLTHALRGGGGGRTITIGDVVVQMPEGSHVTEPQEFAERLRELLPATLQQAVETVDMELGIA